MSSEEYQNVLKHIDVYIETIINKKIDALKEDQKRQESVIDQKLALHIATIVKEQIIHYKYTLTDKDIERIAEVVRSKLAAEMNKEPKVLPFVLSQENLEEVSKIVKQNIEIHRHEWIVKQQNSDAPQTNLDIDEILFKILSSTKLTDLIDQRVKASPLAGQISDQQITINQLQNDMNDLKEKFRNAFIANNDMHISIEQLQTRQNDLDEKIASAQIHNSEQLDKVLREIDEKLTISEDKQFNVIDNHIRVVLAEILSYKTDDGKPLQNADITNWIRSVFVAKDLLEERLSELNAKFDNKINEEINQSADVLIKSISESIKRDIHVAIEQKQKELHETGQSSSVSLDEKRIRAIIKEALAVYDADKTGMVDYALESAGGEILSTRWVNEFFSLIYSYAMEPYGFTIFNQYLYQQIQLSDLYERWCLLFRCTENFHIKSAEISIFGVPLWYKSNTPRTVISPTVQPGECWSFQGFPGYLVLKLNNNVFVTGFTMEHIPKLLAPNGRIDSAPKLFTVWVMSFNLLNN